MIGLEKGKRYLFMTLTFYWDGVVTELYPSHAVLEKARLVKDIGEEPDFKKWARSDEVHHKVWVPLPNVQIVAL